MAGACVSPATPTWATNLRSVRAAVSGLATPPSNPLEQATPVGSFHHQMPSPRASTPAATAGGSTSLPPREGQREGEPP